MRIEEDRPWHSPEPGSFEEGRLAQLDRLIVLDKSLEIMTEAVNESEAPVQNEWVEAATFTRNILRRATFTVMMDLLEHGDVDAYITTKQTIGAVPHVAPNEAADYFQGVDPRKPMEEVAVFIRDQRAPGGNRTSPDKGKWFNP